MHNEEFSDLQGDKRGGAVTRTGKKRNEPGKSRLRVENNIKINLKELEF
jgi:hypothetical protein